jgi:hypothetical protein
MTQEKLFVFLTCADCGGELSGGESARIYVCFVCGKAFIMDKYPSSLPLIIYKPKIDPIAGLFYVPFFRIKGKFSFDTRYPDKARIYSNMNPLQTIHYPAFLNLRNLYSDDLTLRYALGLKDAEFVKTGEKVRLVDGTRTPVKLENICRLVWLSYLDKVADVTGVEGEFEISEVSYSLVPFEKVDNGLRELMLGITLKGFTEFAPNGK